MSRRGGRGGRRPYRSYGRYGRRTTDPRATFSNGNGRYVTIILCLDNFGDKSLVGTRKTAERVATDLTLFLQLYFLNGRRGNANQGKPRNLCSVERPDVVRDGGRPGALRRAESFGHSEGCCFVSSLHPIRTFYINDFLNQRASRQMNEQTLLLCAIVQGKPTQPMHVERPSVCGTGRPRKSPSPGEFVIPGGLPRRRTFCIRAPPGGGTSSSAGGRP